MSGWIKLYRKIQRSQVYRNLNSKQRDVMMQCLIMANHDNNEWEWQGEIYRCEPGQFITSLHSLSHECAKDVKVQSVRTALLKLEKWGFLTNESTKTGRRITICNWLKYQAEENETNKRPNKELTKHQQSSNKALTTNKNVKNEKNEKKKTIRTKFVPPSLEQVKAYCLERKNNVNPVKWHSHYTSNGWKVGKNKMVDWKAAVRTWENNDNETNSRSNKTPGYSEPAKPRDWLS